MNLRIALAQINPTVGDLPGNRRKIEEQLELARRQEVDLVAFPEMAVTGYPPEDLLLKPDFVYAARQTLLDLLPQTKGLVAVIGGIWVEDDLYNSALVVADGQLQAVYHKQLLPNYGVFDENRYFKVGQTNTVFRYGRGLFRGQYLRRPLVPGRPGPGTGRSRRGPTADQHLLLSLLPGQGRRSGADAGHPGGR